MSALLLQGSAHAIPLRDESVQCVVTSPPYWRLRVYEGEQRIPWMDGTSEPLGLEPTHIEYVEHIVEVFREIRRVLRDDGTVWTIATTPFSGAHFATFPLELAEKAVLAGSARDDIVLDPFAGTSTTGRAALRNGRDYVGLDLSRTYLADHSRERLRGVVTAVQELLL